MKVKSPAESAAKWSERASSASGDYIEGVQNPKNDWKQSTIAAAETWKLGTQKAMSEGRFAKGVNKAGSQKQIDNSISKGARRFGEGVAIAQNDYADGVAPFLDIIERTQLPPRGPKGDPKNIDRVAKIAAALHQGKLAAR
jgi:hypothetical protein